MQEKTHKVFYLFICLGLSNEFLPIFLKLTVFTPLHSEVVIYRKVRNQVNETQKRLREIEDFIDKRAKLFRPLQPPLETIRLIARGLYRFYIFYNPEFALFGCMFQYARIEYPDVVQSMRIDEMRQTGQSVYQFVEQLMEKFLKTGLNGDLSSGRKLTALKTGQNFPQRMPRKMSKRSTGQLNLSDMYSKRYRLRIKTEPKVTNDNNRQVVADAYSRKASKLTENEINKISTGNPTVSENGLDGKPFTQNTTPAVEKQTEKPLNSKEDSPKRKIDNFTLEKFVLRSIGIDPESIREWTPTYCGKEYVKNFVRRFFNRIVLA